MYSSLKQKLFRLVALICTSLAGAASADIYGQFGYTAGQDGVLLMTEKCPATAELQLAVARFKGTVVMGCYAMNNRGNVIVKWESGQIEELDGNKFTFQLTQPSTEVKVLMDRESALNSKCRGQSGNFTDTMKVCEQRDQLIVQIQAKGWCWGHEDQIGAERKWEKCKPKHSIAPAQFPKPAWCKNAKKPHEITTCANEELATTEHTILAMYAEYSKLPSTDQTTLKDHKSAFQKKYSDCQTSIECVAATQAERINFYKSKGVQLPSR